MKLRWTKRMTQDLITFCCLVFAFFSLMQFVQKQMEIKQLNSELAQVQDQLEQTNRDNVALVEQKTKLSDSNYIKEFARGNFMLTQENEQIFILPRQTQE